MISKKDALSQAPGGGALLIVTLMLTMGGFSADGDSSSLELRIINLEENASQALIQQTALQSDFKHYEKLMEKQIEQNEKIYNLLLQLCQGMASISDHKCST